MDCKEFLEIYYKNTNQQVITDVEFFLVQVKELFNEAKETLKNSIEKDIYSAIFEDKNNITLLAYKLKNKNGRQGNISISKLLRFKKFLMNFVEYLYDKDLLSNYSEISKYISELTPQNVLSEDIMSHLYFKSTEDVINSIDEIGYKLIEAYNPNSDLLEIKTIAILLWKGFNPQMIASLKKKDLITKNMRHYISFNDNGKIIEKELSSQEQLIIQSYCHDESQITIPSGKRIYYSPSEFIIKSKAKTKLKGNTVISRIHNYNLVASKHSMQSLNSTVLMKCGFFEELRNYCITHPENTVRQNIKALANCDNRTVYDLFNVYTKWMNMFYN